MCKTLFDRYGPTVLLLNYANLGTKKVDFKRK